MMGKCIPPTRHAGKFAPRTTARRYESFCVLTSPFPRRSLLAPLFATLVSLGRLAAQDSADKGGGDWTADSPGTRHKVVLADLPPPFSTKSAGNIALALR